MPPIGEHLTHPAITCWEEELASRVALADDFMYAFDRMRQCKGAMWNELPRFVTDFLFERREPGKTTVKTPSRRLMAATEHTPAVLWCRHWLARLRAAACRCCARCRPSTARAAGC